MPRVIRLPLLALLGCVAATGAELFRCERGDGSLHFVTSPHACRGASQPVPLRRLERLAAPPAAAAEPYAEPDLAAWLLGADEVGGGFEVVPEAPGEPARDADLVRWGVLAQQARHYTRERTGVIEVCSIELWAFASPEQAEAAHAGFAYPGWQISRAGRVLLMTRGLRRPPRAAPQRGVFPACAELAERVRARATAGPVP